MKIKTSALEGAALDWAVAQVSSPGKVIKALASGGDQRGHPVQVMGEPWMPSTNWRQCGPLIECFAVDLGPHNGNWRAYACYETWNEVEAKRPLIAACRSIVAAKLGASVEVPDGLQ